MGRSVILCSVVLLMTVATRPAAAQDKPADTRRTISVTGQGEVTAAPDLVRLAVAVETTAAKASAAVSENADRSDKVARALKGLMGKDDKLSTTHYSIEPRYEPGKPGQPVEPRIIGYVVHNEVQVETHTINGVGAVIDAAIAAGGNRVSNLQFMLSNRNEQLRAALASAGAEAQAQAESIAKALGVKLKAVVSATTVSAPIIQPRFAMAAMEARPATPIEPGAVSVSATLQVTYEIE